MLWNKSTSTHVPLKSIDVSAHLVDVAATVTMEMVFRNDEDIPIEAVFKFPLNSMSAVCHCEAVMDGNKVVATVKEKGEAQALYDDAISAGKGAYLLEKDKDEVFSMSIGNFPPEKEVTIKIIYITDLVSNGAFSLRFLFPMSIFPQVGPNSVAVQVESVSRLSYKLSLKLQLNMSTKIGAVEILNHSNESLSIEGNSATFECGDVNMAKDFVAEITLMDDEPHIWIEKADSGVDPCAVMINLRPNIDFEESDHDVIFVVDRSGSMRGDPIAKARETMFTSLKHLSPKCTFNIYGFGDTLTKLFVQSRECSLPNIIEARKHIALMDANMGGTNLWSPLKAVFEQQLTSKRIFLLSDGGVSNAEQVVQLVRECIGANDQLFTFAIGSRVDVLLMERLAKEGKGSCTVISEINSSLEAKIIAQVNAALKPAFDTVLLTWEGKGENDILQAPLKLPPIFNKQLYTVYALVRTPSWLFSSVTIHAEGKAGHLSCTIDCKNAKFTDGLNIHRLAARCMIRELDEHGSATVGKDKAKEEIIKIAKLYNLASSHTSFLGVDPRTNSVQETMELRTVPSPMKSFTPSYSHGNIPAAITGCVNWRSEGIKYRKNEFFIDIVESSDFMVSPSGDFVQGIIRGRVLCKSFLSGIPEIRLGLKDNVSFEGRRSATPSTLDDIRFHQCARLCRFENDRTISFIPPDGEFELMHYDYHLEAFPRKAPFLIYAIIEKFPGSKMEFTVWMKANYSSSSKAQAIELLIPVPDDCCSPTYKVNIGNVQYHPESQQLSWKLKSLAGDSGHCLSATFKLPSVESKKPYKLPPIYVKYEIVNHTATVLQLAYMKVIEKHGYKALNWVRHVNLGQMEVRTKEIIIRHQYPTKN